MLKFLPFYIKQAKKTKEKGDQLNQNKKLVRTKLPF